VAWHGFHELFCPLVTIADSSRMNVRPTYAEILSGF